MNAYTIRGQARIRPREVEVILGTDAHLAARYLHVLERQRGAQAEAEVDRLLKQHGITRKSVELHISMLRQTIGAALVRAGQRLAGAPPGRRRGGLSSARTVGTEEPRGAAPTARRWLDPAGWSSSWTAGAE